MTKIDEIRQRITELKAKAKVIGDNPNATLEEVQDIHNKLKVEYEKLKTEEIDGTKQSKSRRKPIKN